MKDLKERFLDGKVIYNQQKIFRWYLSNVKLVQDRNNNWMPTKQSKNRKIDGFASVLNSHVSLSKGNFTEATDPKQKIIDAKAELIRATMANRPVNSDVLQVLGDNSTTKGNKFLPSTLTNDIIAE